MIRPRRLIDRWHRYICGAAIAALAIFGARAPAKADTTFTYSCFSLDGGSSLCPTSLPLTATITFPGTAPLDETNETLFTGPAILTENTPGLSGSVQLPFQSRIFHRAKFPTLACNVTGGGNRSVVLLSLLILPCQARSLISLRLSMVLAAILWPRLLLPALLVAASSTWRLEAPRVPLFRSAVYLSIHRQPRRRRRLYISILVPVWARSLAGQPLSHMRSLILASTAISRQSRPTCRIYAPYNIQFVTTPPNSGTYDTIYIGGTPDSTLPQSVAAQLDPRGVAGLAATINLQNRIPNNSAVVFSGLSFFGPAESALCAADDLITFTCDPSADDRLAQVIAHETGHIVGLVHVTDSSQLIYPDITRSPTVIGGAAPISDQPNPSLTNPNVLLENSSAILGCNLGLLPTGTKDCSTMASEGVYGGAGVAAIDFSTCW